jgi:HD-GYP domain-containing protein (c-di-GMP phosphodiesterase class II)
MTRRQDPRVVRQALDAEAYELDPRHVAGAALRRVIVHNLMMGDARLAEALAHQVVPDDEGADGSSSAASGDGSSDGARADGQPAFADLASVQLKRYAVDLRRTYESNLERTKELEDRALATVRALAAAVAERDDDTGNHIQRVHDLGLCFARAMSPDEAKDPELAYGFILHDIGKVAVPDTVLRKPGPLDGDEWALMRTHPEAGARMLDGVPFLSRAREVVLYHHERWDGQGYPHNLREEEIPLWARMFAVVDAVDAMTSYRPYRAPLRLATALEEIERHAGSQFDPRCVEAFLALEKDEIALRLQHSDEFTIPDTIPDAPPVESVEVPS